MNDADSALNPLINGQNKSYIDSMRAYLRAAIAQFIFKGPGSSAPALHPRPAGPIPRDTPTAGQTNRLPNQAVKPVTSQPTVQKTWATVTKRGQQQTAQPVNFGRTPAKHANLPKATAKPAAPSRQDERLFLRLGKDHDWRQFSPAGIREAATKHLGLPPTTIGHVYRVPTGFAIKAKDEETRQSLLDSAEAFTPLGAKLEKASDLVVLRFSTVPVALNTAMGRIIFTEELIRDEIVRNTDMTPLKVRPHGKNRLGAPQQSWLAYFKRVSAPRPGFRLFDESGVAVRHQPKRTVQQCKRCLEFHGTRGCSRAPTCWNCSSKMHSTSECKAHTKCRNCGGPHRSDSRSCLARPTRSGPVTKEQLATIRQASQLEFAAVARAKAAVMRAEAAAIAAAVHKPASPPALSTSNQFEVLAEDTILPDAEATGETNPETHL